MQLYRLSATSGVPSGKNGDYTGIGAGVLVWSTVVDGLAREGASPVYDYLQSSFFINPASAANGLCVALAIFGELNEPSLKYCWSV